MRLRSFAGVCLLVQSCLTAPVARADDASLKPNVDKTSEWRLRIESLAPQIEKQPRRVSLFSERGDLHFFSGDFSAAVADYTRTIEIEPEQDASHWRRGIALFYAGKFEDAAGQFERYHSFDQVDRENGIWRYLSQRKAFGQEKARAGLLKYEKDDREPFPDVYRLFAGTIEPDVILKRIESSADLEDDERHKRNFYAELYIGLNEAVEGRDQAAVKHLERAVANDWPQTAGYGPHYMWHVGRLHLEQLRLASPPKLQQGK